MFLVDGKPFFPLGIWVYNLDSNVMADLREHRVNTVVGGGFRPDDVPLIEKHGLMMIPHATDEFLAKAKDSPALLGWHLTDEPEEHNVSPAQVKKLYDALKAKANGTPLGVTHNQFLSLEQFKGTSDFTMTNSGAHVLRPALRNLRIGRTRPADRKPHHPVGNIG